MLKLSVILTAVALPVAAFAQQPAVSWQDLALRTQQNATVQQMIDNSMISALQAEIAELKAQLAKKPDPGGGDPPPAPR